MFKKGFFLLTFIFISNCFAQTNQLWQGYFSYNLVKDIAESPTTLYAASENALFLKNLSSNSLKTINSIDGLKAETISTVYHSSTINKTFIGNTNGLLLVVNQDGTVLFKNGIVEEVPVSPFIKRINHFYEYNNKIYISCDYGITVFDLTTLEFGDTYFIGDNGASIKIQQITVFNDELYATTQFNGIKKAAASNPNLVDFSQWQVFDGGFWTGVVTFNNQLVGANADGRMYRFNGNVAVEFANINQFALDSRVYQNNLIVSNAANVYVYNEAFQQQARVQSFQITEIPVTFSCATVINGIVYIGTNENGVLSTPLANPTSFEFIMPNGPVKNNVFRVKKSSTALWALYGRYSRLYNPYDPTPGEFPISKFSSDLGWTSIPYSDLFGAKSLSNIAFSPNNQNDFYISSYFSGLLKVEDEVPTQIFNNTNTGSNGLETLVLTPVPDPNYIDIRVNGPAFDKEGNLWMTNNFVEKGLKVLRANGQWQSYDLSDIIPETLNESYAIPVIDKNNTKWLPTQRNGLVAFNETVNKSLVIKNDTQGNLPIADVRCVAIDNRNQMWIGTGKGLRIISSVDQFLSQEEIETRSIIILEDNLAQELFFEQFILDIAVDGANRKWVSTAGGGVFLVSANGQETIFKFTKENSPLPSNDVNDIEIDGVSGEVFFATDRGLVSFKGTSTKPSNDLQNVYAYPNPVRPGFDGTVKIAGLTNRAIIKITDIEGNLVFETTSEGGTIEWDTKAFGKYKVASGVYMILVSAEDGIDTTVKKVMIIR